MCVVQIGELVSQLSEEVKKQNAMIPEIKHFISLSATPGRNSARCFCVPHVTDSKPCTARV